MLTDSQAEKKGTNEWTELHQFRKQLSYDGDLSPCQVFELESGNESVDRQTDVGRINLIGGLVSPWFSMYHSRVIHPSSLMVNLAHTPSAEIQLGGAVGLSSVPHGKLVAYKSYI